MDEKIRLQLDVLGVKDAQDLRDRLSEVKGQLDTSRAAYDRNAVGAKEAAKEIRALAQEAGKLEKALAGIDKGKTGLAGFGQLTQSTGRIIQDFQAAGLNGIVNNLEQLGGGMAKVAGLAPGWGPLIGGVFQLVGVAGLVAGPHIAKFFAEIFKGSEGLGSAADRLKSLEERIKGLAEKPHKIVMEVENLQELERQAQKLREDLEAFDRLDKQRTNQQKRVSEAFDEAIREHAGGDDKRSGADRVKEAIIETMKANGDAEQMVPSLAAARQARERADSLEASIKAAIARGDQQTASNLANEAQQAKEDAKRMEAEGKEALESKGGVAESLLRPTEENRARLERYVKANPKAFTGNGINVQDLADHLQRVKSDDEEEAGAADFDKRRMQEEMEEDRYQNYKKDRDNRRSKLLAMFGGTARSFQEGMMGDIGEGKSNEVIEEVYVERLKKLMRGKIVASEAMLDHVSRRLIKAQLRDAVGDISTRQASNDDGQGNFPGEAETAQDLAIEMGEKRTRPGQAKADRAKRKAEAKERKELTDQGKTRSAVNAVGKAQGDFLDQFFHNSSTGDEALYGSDLDEQAKASLAQIHAAHANQEISAQERNALIRDWRREVKRASRANLRARGYSSKEINAYSQQAAGRYEGDVTREFNDTVRRLPQGMNRMQSTQQGMAIVMEQMQMQLQAVMNRADQIDAQVKRALPKNNRR